MRRRVIAYGRYKADLDAHLLLLGVSMFGSSLFQPLSRGGNGRSPRTGKRIAHHTDSDKRLWMPHCKTTAYSDVGVISRAVLLDALRTGQIQAWLQPKVSVLSQQLVAIEALARWRHPQWGLLTPNVFLPWFSAHGLDEALLMHILQEVLGLQAKWRWQQDTVVPVSVNLPTHLLDDASLPDRLLARVQRCQARACDITFELLENSDTKTPCALFMGAWRLVSMGFGLAQDDAGVSYSSMQRFAGTPFSELKLDRRFVHGLSGGSLQVRGEVRYWIAMAKQRGVRVTAEGVETAAHLEWLQQMGCDYAQGYFFSKPVPAFELEMWMRQRLRV